MESSAGFDRGAATAGALVETEQCQYHLLTLERGGELRNLHLHFDAEIESDRSSWPRSAQLPES